MNPSVQELSSGMDNGQYEKYIILPNNKNIILAAQQLQKMLGEKVHIVPSTNPMEGLAAAMAFSEDQSLEDNLSAMNERMGDITTAMITTAVRDSIVGNAVIHKDDFMGIMKNHEVIAEKTSPSASPTSFPVSLRKIRKSSPSTPVKTSPKRTA